MGKMRIDVEGAGAMAIDDLTEFQGNLKDLTKESYEKLRADMLKYGFSEPVTVWRTKKATYILNGHQRVRALMKMREEGHSIPKIPVTFVKAKDMKEAKRKVLALTSQFGEITHQGLYEFMHDADISVKELQEFRFAEVDLAAFEAGFFKDPLPGADGSKEVSFMAGASMKHKCPKCGFEFNGK